MNFCFPEARCSQLAKLLWTTRYLLEKLLCYVFFSLVFATMQKKKKSAKEIANACYSSVQISDDFICVACVTHILNSILKYLTEWSFLSLS